MVESFSVIIQLQTSRRFVSSSTVLCIAVCVCRQQGAQSAGYPDGAARAAQPQHLPVGRDPGQAQRPGGEGAALISSPIVIVKSVKARCRAETNKCILIFPKKRPNADHFLKQ